MAGREDLAPKGLDILTRDVSLDEIQSLFDITTGHDHDGTNSALVSWNNIADKPSGSYYSLTAPTNEFTSSDDGAGNLTLSWKTQSAGLVLASPSASSGTPSFRPLIISDIPTITLAKLDNIASGSILGRKTALTGEVEALTITDIKTMLDVINYGVCTTDGATVNKTVDITNFALSLGTKVTVKFSNANTATNPTLNVSSTGAKAIYNGSSAIDPAMLEAGKIYDFVYDGTNYVLISGSGSGSGSVTTPISKTITATAGQTEFTYTDLDGWTDDLLGVLVFRNGIYMTPTTDYTLDAVLKTITFVTPCEVNEIITVIFNNSGANVIIPNASESTKGIIEIATSAEVLAGTDTTKAVTSNTLNDALDSYAPKNTPIILKTESYTLALTDNYSLNKCLSASDIIITIPLNSNVAFPIGSELIFVRYGTGEVTFTPAVGVTLYSSGSKRTINMQYEFVTLKKMATDEWILLGSLG